MFTNANTRCLKTRYVFASVMLSNVISPRGQAGLEAKILSSASTSKICPRPQPRPRAFVLGLSSNFLFWPRENECNDGIGNHSDFAMIIYQSYLLTLSLCYINLFN